MEIQTQAFFTNGRREKLFNVLISPKGMRNSRAILIFIPALWDEMNHSRHIVAAQARLFASKGIATLILDPEGTGDSYGDYSSIEWGAWVADYVDAWEQYSAKYNLPISFWGMRTGALLASELVRRCDTTAAPLLLWNPVPDGEMALREMIRVKLASTLMSNSQSTNIKSIRAELDIGKTVNMAGYDVSGRFSGELVSKKLTDLIPDETNIIWIDVVRNLDAKESPARQNIRKLLENNNSIINFSKVEGPMFWQSVELEFIPELLSSTILEFNKVF